MPVAKFSNLPDKADFVQFSPGFGRRFLVTVDAEEEFDWSRPLQREGHSLDSVPRLAKFQQFCDGFGVRPVYLVDFPIVTHAEAAELLTDFVRSNRASVGIQLHPWVNPPFREDVTRFSSFAGNLPPDLEREKLLTLRNKIAENIGAEPLIYRAGRYGVGPNTIPFLNEAGVRIDTSVRSLFDYSSGDGPDFRNHPLRPYWLDRDAGLAEFPLTTVYWGMLRQLGPKLFPMLQNASMLRGGLAKLALLERIALTPEGIGIDEAIRGIDIALDDGLQVLNFSFHSPSLRPGHTPYIRNEADLDDFYDWWRGVFAYLDQRGVMPASLPDLLEAMER